MTTMTRTGSYVNNDDDDNNNNNNNEERTKKLNRYRQKSLSSKDNSYCFSSFFYFAHAMISSKIINNVAKLLHTTYALSGRMYLILLTGFRTRAAGGGGELNFFLFFVKRVFRLCVRLFRQTAGVHDE